MVYFAVGLAAIGVAAGLAFRWKILLPIIVLLPLAAIIFSVSRGFSYEDTAIGVFVAEGILQGGYFVGLLIRFIATAGLRRALDFFRARRDREKRGNDPHVAPPAEAGEAP
jgi:hypothetical protein